MTARSGPLIASVFGLIFVLSNAGSLPQPAGAMLEGIAFAVFVAIALTLRRRTRRLPAQAPATGSVFGRGYRMVVAGELVAIAAGLVVLNGPLDAPRAGVAWISLVVGLHCVALAFTLRQQSLRALRAAIATCGAAGLVLAATQTTSRGARPTDRPPRSGSPLAPRRLAPSSSAPGSTPAIVAIAASEPPVLSVSRRGPSAPRDRAMPGGRGAERNGC